MSSPFSSSDEDEVEEVKEVKVVKKKSKTKKQLSLQFAAKGSKSNTMEAASSKQPSTSYNIQ